MSNSPTNTTRSLTLTLFHFGDLLLITRRRCCCCCCHSDTLSPLLHSSFDHQFSTERFAIDMRCSTKSYSLDEASTEYLRNCTRIALFLPRKETSFSPRENKTTTLPQKSSSTPGTARRNRPHDDGVEKRDFFRNCDLTWRIDANNPPRKPNERTDD